MLLMICFESAGAHSGEPEYLLLTTPFGMLTVLDSARSWVRNMRVVPPLPAADTAVADRIAEGHQHLIVAGIAVVPHDPEVGPGDGETFDGLVRALRPGHPADERCPRRRAGRWRGSRRRCGYRLSIAGASGARRRRNRWRRHACLLLNPRGLRRKSVEDRPRQPTEVGQRRALICVAWLVAYRRAVEAGQFRSHAGVRSRGRLGLRGRTCARLGGRRGRDADPTRVR